MKLSAIMTAVLALTMPLVSGCPTDLGCMPHEFRFCTEERLYWVDSCGELDELIETCACGCAADRAGCRTACEVDPVCPGGVCEDECVDDADCHVERICAWHEVPDEEPVRLKKCALPCSTDDDCASAVDYQGTGVDCACQPDGSCRSSDGWICFLPGSI